LGIRESSQQPVKGGNIPPATISSGRRYALFIVW